MKNLRELFTQYPFGFDNYPRWLDHHREMHRRHPLDVPEFGAEWLRRWEAVGRLLDAPAAVEVRFRPRRQPWQWFALTDANIDSYGATVADCVRYCEIAQNEDERQRLPHTKRRIILLDGTIIRE